MPSAGWPENVLHNNEGAQRSTTSMTFMTPTLQRVQNLRVNIAVGTVGEEVTILVAAP